MSITDELRKWGYGFCGDTHDVVTAIADRIDAEYAQLERDYKVACEVNERQDEQYADMVHKRAPLKGGVTDLEKAANVLEKAADYARGGLS